MRYVLIWLVPGAVIATAAVLLLRDSDPVPVAVPPLQETELSAAARQAGCELRRFGAHATGDPPVDAVPAAAAARPGVYEEPLPAAAAGAAVRRGIVVIHHRPEVSGEVLGLLRSVQRTAPDGTIVTPARARMPYELAVTAYRRLLGCRQFTEATIDALLLFRGRYLGSGPRR